MNNGTKEVWPPGTEVFANHNFSANSREDLAFKRRDILTILRATQDPNWYIAKNAAGAEGMIPANYVQKRVEVKLHSMPWFHGKIARSEAESLLRPRKDGLFLVRESTNYPGDYTLCVCSQDKVEHYHIVYKNNKLTIDEEEFFENLTQLVEHYEKDADGLCSRLISALQKKGQFETSVDTDQFVQSGWSLKHKDIEFGEVIGKGEFGDVLKGTFRGVAVAIKQLKNNTNAAQIVLREASLMTSLQHPNLVQLLGIVLGDTIYIVTEFMGKGNLVDYLRTRGRNVISKKDLIGFSSDTCRGMEALEHKNIIHRDLAARNILISDDCVAKVSDFGLARHENANQEGGKFPIKWTAPEALKNNKFSNKSDMWSFGILLWEIYSFGKNPYPRIPLAEVVQHVERGYRMENPEGCPVEVYEIMRKAWQKNPDDRPAFHDARIELDKIRAST